MNTEELIKLAHHISHHGDVTDILMFADLMMELGDIRHEAVRKHASCCVRGKNIIENLSYEGKIYTSNTELNSFRLPKNPKDWPCYN